MSEYTGTVPGDGHDALRILAQYREEQDLSKIVQVIDLNEDKLLLAAQAEGKTLQEYMFPDTALAMAAFVQAAKELIEERYPLPSQYAMPRRYSAW